ncbi:peptidase M1, membrane alanine aminopeptidase [Jimgerdemannia flammicorona]|uniref:Peptidase M1, membrane alanine aminopeptidase n=1 Tax=Jimgerdemannia flammicorona TaxID=994334 RepID=A0A433D2V1_9FUNG|nr:peptidase M1, membrane alanine aminopeptidase [Jimgerdemannia flammicorona]
MAALSNLNVIADESIINTEDDSALREVKFARTPIMSTYLLAFIVGPFEHIEAFTSSGIRTRVYALPNQVEQGRFALGVATKALDLFADVFGIPFPLPKMDMVAIPDFIIGELMALPLQ